MKLIKSFVNSNLKGDYVLKYISGFEPVTKLYNMNHLKAYATVTKIIF